MLFSSTTFLLYFFPIVFTIYYLVSFSRFLQNVVLFLASLYFYAWGEKEYVALLVVSIALNTAFGYLVDRYRAKTRIAKWILGCMCTANIGILFYFKYFAFTIRNINQMFCVQIPIPSVVLPLGISFFTFQAISYVVDVYRNDAKVQKNPLYVGLYISLFPQLIAGPIVRYESIAKQINSRKSTIDKLGVGLCRFIVGLSKKMLVANNMAIVADHIFELTPATEVSVALAWLGSIAYTLQIYFDFSGYSDMAIGLGLVFGFEFEENFRYPYVAKSVSEFWRRWHISLTTWFKDYVYFPLGGSRVTNKDKMVRNMLAVWFLTGLWHGAEWTFIVWGLLNFLIIIIERFLGIDKAVSHLWFRNIVTLFFINIGWVVFRSVNLYEAGIYLKNMVGWNQNSWYSPQAGMFLKEYWLVFAAGIIFSTPVARRINEKLMNHPKSIVTILMELCYPAVMAALLVVCIIYMVKGAYNPFIYFNF